MHFRINDFKCNKLFICDLNHVSMLKTSKNLMDFMAAIDKHKLQHKSTIISKELDCFGQTQQI